MVLAGGRGRRIGGGKPARTLAGRPLAARPAEALAAVCDRVAIVCKPSTDVPALPGVERWDEPDGHSHPAVGIAHALERAGGPVLVCAADMPFVTAASCERVAAALGPADEVAVAVAGGVVQPLLAAYAPSALGALRAAAPDAPLTGTVESLRPRRVEVPAAEARSVDTPEELAAAERELGSG
ncbi:MAG TPA: NTP transferase domain-containing protein [Thermoleophilaceae bacterium]